MAIAKTVQSNPKNQTLVFIRNDWHVLFTLPYWNCTLYYFRLGNLTFHVIPAADIRGDKVLSRRDSNPKSPRQVQWTVEKNYLYDGIVAIINGMLAASVSEILNVSCIVSCCHVWFYFFIRSLIYLRYFLQNSRIGRMHGQCSLPFNPERYTPRDPVLGMMNVLSMMGRNFSL